jgi:ParB-like chromosome segregation protein Spo0J
LAESKKPKPNVFQKAVSYGKDLVKSVERGLARGKAANVAKPTNLFNGTASDAEIDEIARINREIKQIGGTAVEQDFSKHEGVWDTITDWIKIAPPTLIESMAMLGRSGYDEIAAGTAVGAGAGSVVPVIGTAAGAATGFTAGSIAAGAGVEFFSSFFGELEKMGVDTGNPQAIKAALKNPEILSKARKTAAIRAGVIGGGSALVGAAASGLRPIASGLTQAAGEFGVELGAQAASGQDINLEEAGLEAIGELPVSAITAKGLQAARKAAPTQLGGMQTQTAPQPTKRQNKDGSITVTVGSKAEIPEQYQDRARKGMTGTATTLPFGLGKKTNIEQWSYNITPEEDQIQDVEYETLAPTEIPPVPESTTEYVAVSPEELQAFQQGQIDPERAAAIADDVALIQSGQMDINSIDDANYRVMVESALGAGQQEGAIIPEQFQRPQITLPLPKITVSGSGNLFIPLLQKLGYTDEEISGMTMEQQQEIVSNRIEPARAADSSKVDVIKENAKQERLAEMNAELDREESPILPAENVAANEGQTLADQAQQNLAPEANQPVEAAAAPVATGEPGRPVVEGADVSAEVVEEEGVKPSPSFQGIESFETAKGSVYTVLPDGRTQRFKTATNEQDEPQDLTVFVKFKDADQEQDFLQGVQRSESSGTKVYLIDQQGNKYDTNEQAAGKDVRLALVKDGKVIDTVETSTTPKVGYNTFDQRRFKKDGEQYRQSHLGNKVVKINATQQTPAQQGSAEVGDIERRKRMSGSLISVLWARLAKEGIQNADPIIGTRETIDNVDYDKFWQNVTKEDLESLKGKYLKMKQDQLEAFERQGKEEGKFDPQSGVFTSSDASFYDNKIKDVDAELAAQQVATLRAEEQAEYDAMPDPNDVAKREEIYGRYDKLIREAQGEKAAPVAKEKPAPSLRDVEFTMRRPEKNEIVFVPIDALLKKHAADQPSFDIQKEGNRIKGRVEKAKEFLKNYLNDQRAINPKTGERMKSKVTFEPSVVDIDENGKISFEDGRHRVLAAKELGITEVPIEVPKGKVKAVESLLSKEEGKPKPESKPKADPFATFDTKGEEKALAEKEFYKKYTAQHKDIRAQSLEEKQATKNKILAEGFKEQGRNVNALPIYRGPDGTITDKQYGNKKGDFVYLLPKEGVVNTRNGYVNKAGYIPGKFDVVEIEYDGQPTYEAYSNQFKKADNPFSVFETAGEEGRKARAKLKESVGNDMFKQIQKAHKNAEKILRSFPESFKIDCP